MKAAMTLIELQEILGERIKIANDPSPTPATRKMQNEQSQMICSLAKQMINNADVMLRTEKLVTESKLQGTNIQKVVGE